MCTTKKILIGLAVIAMYSCSSPNKGENSSAPEETTEEQPVPVNTLSEKEKDQGWTLLFNGQDFEGWRGYLRQDIPSAWTIDDGAIRVNAGGENDAPESRGDIIYDEKVKNFEFQFEWKVAEGGNSGIFYLAREFEGMPIYRSAPEYQILDNVNHPDAKMGIQNNRMSASLYDLIPAQPQNSKSFGEWNVGKITVNNGQVEHWQNGELVLKYELWTPEWEEMIENSKFKGWTEMIQAGGEEKMGHVGLQDHGDTIWFRNIKLRKL